VRPSIGAAGLRSPTTAPVHDVSRRGFLKYGVLSLAFASVISRAQSATPLRGTTDAVAPEPDTEKLLTVTVRIDGNGPYRFVVDTGADRTVLASDLAAELGLAFIENVMLQGAVRAVKAQTVTIRELSFGLVRYQSLVVPTLPRSTLGADGYLGLDTLDGHRVTFDFKNHTLQVGAPHSRLSALLVGENEARIRTVGSSGHLRALNCMVDGVRAAAFIDSGADLSAGNQALFDALASRNPAYGAMGRISLVDVTGGEISGSVTMVNKIHIMELELTDCALVIADFKVFDVWGLTQRPALLIGMNVLRRFSKVSIDYGRKELRFDRASLIGPELV
jgi:predicted aspartyl protease